MSNNYAIVNAQILTGNVGETFCNGNILISEGRVCGVNATEVPEGFETIDACGKTVMPGMIDAHIHFFGAGLPPKMMRTWAPEVTLLKSLEDARSLLRHGFTTVRDCGGLNAIYLRDAGTVGYAEGTPHIIASGHILAPTNSGLDDPELPDELNDYRTNHGKEFLRTNGIDECIRNTRIAIRKGADFIKIFNSGHYSFPHCPETVTCFTDAEIKTIVDVAQKANGLTVAAHCQSDASSRQAIDCGVRSIEHAIGVSLETAKAGAEAGVAFTSVLGFAELEPQKNERVWEKMVSGYRNIREAGGVLAIGSDMNSSPMFPFGKNAYELKCLVDYCGFTAAEAITVATKNGAYACGVSDDRGTIEIGKRADVIIVDGNPLEDIGVLTQENCIVKVFVDGKLVVDKE